MFVDWFTSLNSLKLLPPKKKNLAKLSMETLLCVDLWPQNTPTALMITKGNVVRMWTPVIVNHLIRDATILYRASGRHLQRHFTFARTIQTSKAVHLRQRLKMLLLKRSLLKDSSRSSWRKEISTTDTTRLPMASTTIGEQILTSFFSILLIFLFWQWPKQCRHFTWRKHTR